MSQLCSYVISCLYPQSSVDVGLQGKGTFHVLEFPFVVHQDPDQEDGVFKNHLSTIQIIDCFRSVLFLFS